MPLPKWARRLLAAEIATVVAYPLAARGANDVAAGHSGLGLGTVLVGASLGALVGIRLWTMYDGKGDGVWVREYKTRGQVRGLWVLVTLLGLLSAFSYAPLIGRLGREFPAGLR